MEDNEEQETDTKARVEEENGKTTVGASSASGVQCQKRDLSDANIRKSSATERVQLQTEFRMETQTGLFGTTLHLLSTFNVYFSGSKYDFSFQLWKKRIEKRTHVSP